MDDPHKFERDFMRRTLHILEDYAGPYDATLLLNCLLGLLIVPREALIDRIPRDPLTQHGGWGIALGSIRQRGRPTRNNPHPDTLRGLVRSLRDAVAHFHVRPLQGGGQVHGFSFSAGNGFQADISLAEIRVFVRQLAAHIEREHTLDPS